MAKEPAVAAKALVGRITKMLGSDSKDFKVGSTEFKTALAAEVKSATKEMAAQIATMTGDSSTAGYRVETEKLVGMEGTPEALAQTLADLEAKTDKETAGLMLKAWQTTSKIAVESGQFKAVGESDQGEDGEPSELEVEATKFKADNPSFNDAQALAAVRLRRMNSVREAK